VLVLPAMGWFLWFLLIPMGFVVVYSLATKGTYGGIVYRFSVENYVRATDWIYMRIFWNSLKLATLTALSCLLIGYPMAYVMATASARMRSALLVLVVIPFWTNFVVRAYAIKVLFGELGPVNQLAQALRLIHEPIIFANSAFSVWLGMVTNYLPFMVLPLYVALEKFDFALLEAAKDLGAPGWKILLKVLIPLTKPGIITGIIFVFTPALGEFVIPDLLGGARTMLIGNLITEQFLKTRDWPFGSALSLLLIVIVMASLAIYLKVTAQESDEEATAKGTSDLEASSEGAHS
jgi:spermidine/putrescine transport system permease protein